MPWEPLGEWGRLGDDLGKLSPPPTLIAVFTLSLPYRLKVYNLRVIFISFHFFHF